MAGEGQNQAAATLPEFLIAQRWFGGKARRIRSAAIEDAADLSTCDGMPAARLVIVRVHYDEGPPETYLAPLADLAKEQPAATSSLANEFAGGPFVDVANQAAFWERLHEWIAAEHSVATSRGRLIARRHAAYDRICTGDHSEWAARVLRADHSNSAAVLGERFLLKLFRKSEPGENPELEVSQFLSDVAGFGHVPALAGSIEYRDASGAPFTVAVMHEYLAGSRSAWDVTLEEFGRFLTGITSDPACRAVSQDVPDDGTWRASRDVAPTEAVRQTIGLFLASAARIGQRTAQLHLALGSRSDHAAFAPESFGPHEQRRLHDSLREHAGRVLRALEALVADLPEAAHEDARAVLALEPQILGRFQVVLERSLASRRIRCHGDYHLGQVLSMGDDFAIIDFEGEPMRSLAARTAKRSPLCDVAGMIRSFHYASQVGLKNFVAATGTQDATEVAQLSRGARFWFHWIAAVFLTAYRREIGVSPGMRIAPVDYAEFTCLLDTFLLEKALYEVHYELNNRPDWVGIPLRGVLDVMSTSPTISRPHR